jgi:NADPH2:quinone reductase
MRKTFKAMAPYGRVVTLTGTPGDTSDSDAYNANLTIHNVMMLTPMWWDLPERLRAQAQQVRQGLALLAEGKLRVVVDRVFPLGETAAAHDYLEGGHAIGKIALSVE